MTTLFLVFLIIFALSLSGICVSFFCWCAREGKGFAFVMLFTIAGIVSGLLMSLGALYAEGYSISHGERSGRIVKLSKRGLFWQTWEGDLQLAGDVSFSAATWQFSVASEATAAELMKHLAAGDRCRHHLRGVRLAQQDPW